MKAEKLDNSNNAVSGSLLVHNMNSLITIHFNWHYCAIALKRVIISYVTVLPKGRLTFRFK